MKDGARPPEETVVRVSGEIDTLREELGGLVAELDRRRHEALDLGLQVRRHPVLAASIAAGAALLLGAAIAVAVRTARARRSPARRAREARHALARIMEHPHRVAAEPSMTNKIATAVGIAVATTLAKRLVQRSVPPAPRARADRSSAART